MQNKEDLANASPICKSCKIEILSQKKFPIKIFPGMFRGIDSQARRVHHSFNAVYLSHAQLESFRIDKYITQTTKQIKDCSAFSDRSHELPNLSNLHRVLHNLLLDRRIDLNLLSSLSKIEDQCLRFFMYKKGMINCIDLTLTEDMFSRILVTSESKRVEEMLKLVVKNIIKFLKKVFKLEVYPFVQQNLRPEYSDINNQSKLEYAFFGFYFGEVASRLDLQIETFFIQGCGKKCLPGTAKFMLKSVSQFYFNYLQMSERFVKDAKVYLQELMIKNMKKNIAKKAHNLCVRWEQRLSTMGGKKFLAWVSENYVNNPKCKQAWSIHEIKFAIEYVLKLLS